jgi:hypothetical protein
MCRRELKAIMMRGGKIEPFVVSSDLDSSNLFSFSQLRTAG